MKLGVGAFVKTVNYSKSAKHHKTHLTVLNQLLVQTVFQLVANAIMLIH